jgi:hypothetical protein
MPDPTRVVALQSVRVIRSSTRLLGIRAGDVLDKLVLNAKAGGTKSPDTPQTVRAFIGMECALSPRDEQREVAKIECDLTLDYAVSDAALFERLTEDECTEFAGLNGLYNAWPYLREFCQSTSLRMGLPTPIMLPTLSPAQQAPKPEDSKAPPT